MNTKLLWGAAAAVVIVAAGGLYLDNVEPRSGYVDPSEEPATLPGEFVLTPTGGGTFNVGDPIVAGFTMTYTGDIEGRDDENSRFFVDEVSVFATSNNQATNPNGKAIEAVNGTARMNGEVMEFDLTGYTCVKEGDVSIVFTKALTRYDIAGVVQTAPYDDRDQFWSGDVFVALKCVEEGEMVQIEPPRVAFPAGQSPLGANESETGFLHDDGHRYYNGERVDQDGSIQDDLGYDE